MKKAKTLTTEEFSILKKYLKGKNLYITRYIDGDNLALVAESDYGRLAPISVNLLSYGYIQEHNHIFVKDYAENEGLADALEKANVATKVNSVDIGFGTGFYMTLNFDAESFTRES